MVFRGAFLEGIRTHLPVHKSIPERLAVNHFSGHCQEYELQDNFFSFQIIGRRIYPFNKGLRIYGVGCTSTDDIKLKLYR